MIRDRTEARTERYKKKRPSDRLNIFLFFYRKQFIRLKPIRAMTSELSDLIWLQDLLAIRLPFLAKVSFQILLTRPAVNDEDDERVELTHYFLRLAPWIVRPASPSARAGTMMAAIRTKFEVALERSIC